ncbi:MAG TPA: heavy metal-associated domain-containing protein [Myxococcales bacterium]|nr:heavy metal-associated domain-containing protein [Myxococcales bacterium]
MEKVTAVVALVAAGVFVALALRDPLAAADLTAAQRAAGLRSVDIEVNGEDCRFCRINVERTLKSLAGVKVAKADMAHHRARVVYDPAVMRPEDLTAAIRGVGVGARLPARPVGRPAPVG